MSSNLDYNLSLHNKREKCGLPFFAEKKRRVYSFKSEKYIELSAREIAAIPALGIYVFYCDVFGEGRDSSEIYWFAEIGRAAANRPAQRMFVMMQDEYIRPLPSYDPPTGNILQLGRRNFMLDHSYDPYIEALTNCVDYRSYNAMKCTVEALPIYDENSPTYAPTSPPYEPSSDSETEDEMPSLELPPPVVIEQGKPEAKQARRKRKRGVPPSATLIDLTKE